MCGIVCCATYCQTIPASASRERWRAVRYGITTPGSTFLPLDHWAYPALERLIAWGYIDSAFLGLRPWTRLTCVRLIAAAEEQISADSSKPEARQIFNSLQREFEPDYRAATADRPFARISVDRLYQRSLGVAGPPINDSYHFGQTIINDYGRPYQEGFNQIAGLSARAESGRFSLSVRGEYQHAPGRSAYPEPVRQAIAEMDAEPFRDAHPVPQVDRFRLVEANAAVAVMNHSISVGKSESWWGPARGGAMALTNNAESFYGFRINRVEPLVLPLISRLLGPVRYEFLIGSLKGHTSPVGPWIHGQKASFKPSPNFEFGVARSVIFAGKGHVPLTFGSFWNSFTSLSNVPEAVKFSRNDPGARYSAFDFSYRVPYLRDWLTIYTDAMTHDDPSPLSAPRRAAFRTGLYLSRVPRVAKLDLRVEAVYTDFPTSRSFGGKFFFWEAVYHQAYTNNGFILGDWIGRESKGGQGWLTYHLSPQERLQVSYRRAKAAPDFVPGGTTQNIWSANLIRRFNRDIEASMTAQFERWKAPLLATDTRSNVSLGLTLTYYPSAIWRSR